MSHVYAWRNRYQQPVAPRQFAPNFDIFLMDKSSTNTTASFLLRSFDDLCTKSFLMLVILLYNFETLTLALFRCCSPARTHTCQRLQRLADTVDELQLDCKSIRTSCSLLSCCLSCLYVP